MREEILIRAEQQSDNILLAFIFCLIALVSLLIAIYLGVTTVHSFTGFYSWCVFYVSRYTIIEPMYLLKEPEFVELINCDREVVDKRGRIHRIIETVLFFSVLKFFPGESLPGKIIYTVIFFIIHMVLLLSYLKFFNKICPKEIYTKVQSDNNIIMCRQAAALKEIKEGLYCMPVLAAAILVSILIEDNYYFVLNVINMWTAALGIYSTVIIPNRLLKENLFVQKIGTNAAKMRKRMTIHLISETIILLTSFIIFANIKAKIKIRYVTVSLATQTILLFSFLKYFEKTCPEEKSETGQ